MMNSEKRQSSPVAPDASNPAVHPLVKKYLLFPANSLFVGGALTWVFIFLYGGQDLLKWFTQGENYSNSSREYWRQNWWTIPLLLIGSATAMYGSRLMIRLKRYRECVACAILACIPILSPCYVIGIPFGLWALIVLLQRDIRAAFDEAK